MRGLILAGLMGLLLLSSAAVEAANGFITTCGKVAHCGQGAEATNYGWMSTGTVCDEPDGSGPVIVGNCTVQQLRKLCPNLERIETKFDEGFSAACNVRLKAEQ